MYNQRLNYQYWHRVTAGFVGEPLAVRLIILQKKWAAGYYHFRWFLGSEISNREETGRGPAPVDLFFPAQTTDEVLFMMKTTTSFRFVLSILSNPCWL